VHDLVRVLHLQASLEASSWHGYRMVQSFQYSLLHAFISRLTRIGVQNGFEVGGIMGTSAGALSGSLYAAGYSPEEVRTSPFLL
jgi:hypothetical protein